MTDVVYVFKYEDKKYEKAVKRLRCSVRSLKDQDVRMFIINNSEKPIKFSYKNVECIHKPYDGPFNKSRSINYCVKNFIESEYFIMSDIDIVYFKGHLEYALNYIPKSGMPARITHYHCEMLEDCYISSFSKLGTLEHKEKMHAPGLGLIHRSTFMDIQGYNEEFLGYSPEDQCFNERIWTVNMNVHLDSSMYTYHLWHDTSGQQHKFKKQNLALWPTLNKKLIANEGKEWGIL